MKRPPEFKNSKGPIFVKRKSRNAETLASFAEYCRMNPGLRFWQALRGWACPGVNFIYTSQVPVDHPGLQDTYYFEKRGKCE